MKRKILLIATLISVTILCVSCAEPFLGGFVAGTAASVKLGQDAQAEFIASVNTLNVEKAKYDTLIAEIKDTKVREALQTLVNNQTAETLEALNKTDWKDPKVLAGYIAALASLGVAGYQKKKRVDESR